MGLLKAMHDFDPAQGIKFETYASIKIRGAILDGIRKNDWVPRTIRQNQKKVFQAKETLRNELKRQPTEKEIATFLEMDITKYDFRCLCKYGVILRRAYGTEWRYVI